MYVCVCGVCVWGCMCVYVRVCVYVCVCGCGCVRASQFGLAIFVYAKNTQNYPLVAWGTGEMGVNSDMFGCHRPIEQRQHERRRRWVYACARVGARVCALVCMCVRAYMRACVHACVRNVFVIYDNNIWPRLIMIIIKIIILYFIQITHTDDSPQRVPG